jgi:hypothetical protein
MELLREEFMTKPRDRSFAIGVAVALAFGPTAAHAAVCAPTDADPVDAVRKMYAGAMAGDRAEMLNAFDRDAFLFDGGVRFTPEAITELILKAEAAGTKPRWRIEAAESHVTCAVAWAAWTNRGDFTTAAGTEPKTWLESATFEWRDGAWKIRFFHSTPILPAP